MFTIEDIINKLKEFWKEQGCLIVEPYDMEMGAGTFHKKTTLDTFWHYSNKKPFRVAYVQPSRRPSDSRFGKHPNRLSKFHQFQVILYPIDKNPQEIYLKSLEIFNISRSKYDIKFIEDDWQSPTLGASGLGYEVRINGMEISQFTYFQKICSNSAICLEITYGIERFAMFVQNKSVMADLMWNNSTKYSDVFLKEEEEMSQLYLNYMDIDILKSHFNDYLSLAYALLENKLSVPAYEMTIKMSHYFNILDARKAISEQERENYIKKIRNCAKLCAEAFIS